MAGVLAACSRNEPPPADTPGADARVQAQEERPGSEVRGRFRGVLPEAGGNPVSPAESARLEQLRSLGYVSGSREVEAPRTITVHDRGRAYAGYNLVVSGHACWAALLDMDGTVLHEWTGSFGEIFPDYPVQNQVVEAKLNRDGESETAFWRRAFLQPGGDLLVIFEGLGLVRLDRDSRVRWARPLPVHHDLQVLPGGEIVTLGWTYHVVPEVRDDIGISEDFVLSLSPRGEPIGAVPIRPAMEPATEPYSWEAAYREFVERDRDRKLMFWTQEIFHTNSIEVLDGSHAAVHPAFRAGNVLLSLRHLDMIVVLDPRAEKIVWWVKGITTTQHDAKLVPGGRILAFNNWVRPGVSSVVQIDPGTRRVVWSYEGTASRPLYSKSCGTAYMLPNGNVLIVESDGGRALEIDAAGETVWEFYNPHRAGEDGRYIATLFDLQRLPPDLERFW